MQDDERASERPKPRIATRDLSSHWYHPDGRACHDQPYADPKRADERRNTTLGDARKLGLYPSVTNILGLLDAPQLTQWKIDQTLQAAWESFANFCLVDDPGRAILNVIEGTYSEWAKKVYEASMNIVREASAFGTSMHDAIEQFVTTGDLSDDPKIVPFMDEFIHWFDQNVEDVYWCERTLVGDRYAGRADCKWKIKEVGVCLLDLKTRRPKSGSKAMAVRSEDKLQLSAYFEADTMNEVLGGPASEKIGSILINSVEPCSPQLTIYNDDDRARHFKVFQNLRDAWYGLRDYEPAV